MANSKPRQERDYVATKGRLSPKLRNNPQNKNQPHSRPVLESGTAVKTVYLSKAPQDWDHEKLEKALENHVRRMFVELQESGRIVRKVIKTVAGFEGDVRIQMLWEILGSKKNKAYRKNNKNAKLESDAAAVGSPEGSEGEPRHPESPESPQESPVPL